MAQYEIAVLYDPSLEVDLSKAEDRVTKIFTSSGGKVTGMDNWGKRKLAYPIKKQEYGIYVFYAVELEPTAVQKIEATLNITDEVIRFLIVKPDLKALAKAEAARAKVKQRSNDNESSSSSDDEQEDEA